MSSRALGWAAAAFLAVFAALALWPALGALVGQDPRAGGVDLQSRLREVQLIWSHSSPYLDMQSASVYPPATYIALGPMGWMSYGALKWVWALSALLGLGWLGVSLGRQGPPALMPVAWVLPFAVSGVAYGLQNGQLHVHVTVAVLFGSLLLIQREGRWGTDLLGAVLLLFALAKPTLAAPFVVLLAALPGRRRPLLLVLGGYLLATAAGLLLIGDGLQPLAHWFVDARGSVAFGSSGSYGNLHALTEWLGLQHANTVSSVSALGLLLVWGLALPADGDVDRLWLRLGLVAVFARIFAYHQDYDDAVLVLTLGGLLTVCRRGSRTEGRVALGLVATMAGLHLLPRDALGLDQPGPGWLGTLRVGAWLLAAALLWRSQGQRAGYPAREEAASEGGRG